MSHPPSRSVDIRPRRLALLSLLLLVLAGCSGGNSDTVTVEGTIRDTDRQRLSGVEAFNADGILATSDRNGLIGFSVPRAAAGSIRLRKPGYTAQTVMLKVKDGKAVFSATLGRRGPSIMLDANQPIDIAGSHGARVSLAAGALVDAAGNPVSGNVALTITPVDVAKDTTLAVFPGAFSGIDEQGDNAPLIMTYGTVEYRFSQNGAELNLAPGQSATIEIPIFVTAHPDGSPIRIGDPGALWYLDENSGIWQQQGSGIIVASPASPTGMALQASIGHFSWWNYDIAPETCELSVTSSGLPAGTSFLLSGRTSAPAPRTASTEVTNNGRSVVMPEGNSVALTAEASTDEGLYRASKAVTCNGATDSTTLVFGPPEKPIIHQFSSRTQLNFGLELDPDNPANTRWVLESQDAVIDWSTTGADLLTLTSDQGHDTTLGNDSGSVQFPLEINGTRADSYLFTLLAETIDGDENTALLELQYQTAPPPIIHETNSWQVFSTTDGSLPITISWRVEAADSLRIYYSTPYYSIPAPNQRQLLLEQADIPQEGATIIDLVPTIQSASGSGYYRLTLEFTNQYGSSEAVHFAGVYDPLSGCPAPKPSANRTALETIICE